MILNLSNYLRESRHGLHGPFLPSLCRPHHAGSVFLSSQLIQSLHRKILRLTQIIKYLETAQIRPGLCTGYRGGLGIGFGLGGGGGGRFGQSGRMLENIQLVVRELARYIRYLYPHPQDDHRHNDHHDDHHDSQYDVVQDTSYLPPKKTHNRPPYVPRYEVKLTTTDRSVPQYIDSYGK